MNVFFDYPGGNPFPPPAKVPPDFAFPLPAVSNGTAIPSGANYTFQDQNIKPTNVQEWNISWQRQVSANWLLSAAYVGSKTSHLWTGHSLNPDVFVLPTMTSAQYPAIVDVSKVSADGASGACTLLYAGIPVTLNPCNSSSTGSTAARRMLSMVKLGPRGGGMFQALSQTQSNGFGTYNGMLLSVQHRLSHGFSVSSNYTWSHCLTTNEIGQDLGNSLQDPNNLRGAYGNCAYDRRQIINSSLVVRTPKFSSSVMQRILGNWTASGIFTASTGAPFTVSPSNSNYSLNGVNNDLPNVYGDPFVGGDVAANPTLTAAQRAACPATVKTWTNWFNPCAFGNNPVAGQYGNESRNAYTGPGRWNLDAALWRSFPVSDHGKLDVRVEGFNVFNHPTLGTPATALSGSTPGRITSNSSTPRQLQGAIKFTF